MAENAALRREIRRRKILENSEARLKKIFGNGNLNSIPENRKEQICLSEDNQSDLSCEDDITTLNKNHFENGFSVIESCEARLPSPKNDAVQESLHDPNTRNLSNGNAKVRSGATGSINNCRDYEFPKKVSDTESRSYCRSKSDSHRRNSCTQLVMDTLQIYEFSLSFVRTWLVVTLAILTRCWLFFDTGSTFYQSILIPLLSMEIGILIYSRLNKKATRNSNSLLSGILILGRVNPDLVVKIVQQINLILEVVKDISVYLFFFTLFHVTCELWL